MKKFMIITHCDLDGIGAAVIGKVVFNKQKVDMKFCGYHNVNDKVIDALVNGDYSHVFITDISVNEETARLIERDFKGKVSLLDHHSHLDYLDNYDWATVEPGEEGERGRESGTSLFYKFLLKTCKFEPNEAMINFVEKVRSYDTWDWANFDNDEEAKQLNDYFGNIGFYDFINKYTAKILKNDTELFDASAKELLKCTQRNIDQAVKTKNSNMIVKKIEKYNIGFVFTEIYHSEIGNKILSLNPNIDAIVLIDLSRGKISLRSTDNSDFDCSTTGKRWFGGGGRKNTGGATIPPELMEQIQDALFKKFMDEPESYTGPGDVGPQGEPGIVEDEIKTIMIDDKRKDAVRKRFKKRFRINSKSDLTKGVSICNNRTGKVYRITNIDEKEDKYFIRGRLGGEFTFLHFFELKEGYCIVKYLDVNQELKIEPIKNVTEELVIKIEDGLYGVERPIVYNVLTKELEIYCGLEAPDPLDIYKRNSIGNRYILIDVDGGQKIVDNFLLNEFYRRVIEEKYI